MAGARQRVSKVVVGAAGGRTTVDGGTSGGGGGGLLCVDWSTNDYDTRSGSTHVGHVTSTSSGTLALRVGYSGLKKSFRSQPEPFVWWLAVVFAVMICYFNLMH